MSCSPQTKKEVEFYSAGFKTIKTVEKTRLYKPNTGTSDYLHYRPIDINVWYPAKPVTDSVLLFRNLLGLLEERANYYGASNAGNGLAQQIAQYLCEGFKCSDTNRLLNFKTKSFPDAPAIQSKFPLVVYLTAYNGMSYENFTLFEALAQKGFVVASISSIGRYPGDMTMKKEDLLEQVNDAVTSFQVLKNNINIDFSNIGIIGYSWGGLAGAMLAGKLPRVACLISLDGSEIHHYGEAKEENTDFDEIINSQHFKNIPLTMPYLRLESSPPNPAGKEDSVYGFGDKLTGDKLILKVDSARHEDFGCLSFVVRESGNCRSNGYFNAISKLSVSFLEEHVKNAGSFSQTLAGEIDNTVRKK
jgi:hypothetical protein